MSDNVGGGAEGALGAVVAAKLRGTRIIEGWVGLVAGNGLYFWTENNKPTLTTQGRCTCGGRVQVLSSYAGANAGLPADWATRLKLDPGVLERIIVVIPED